MEFACGKNRLHLILWQVKKTCCVNATVKLHNALDMSADRAAFQARYAVIHELLGYHGNKWERRHLNVAAFP